MINFFKKNKKYIHSVLFLSTYGKYNCNEIENNEEVKKEYRFRKNIKDTSFTSGNIIINPSIKSKDICNMNIDNLIYIKPKIDLLGNVYLDFNTNETDDIYKKISSSIKVVLLNCNFVGTFLKNSVNGIRDLFYVDNLKISLSPIEKQLNDNLYIKDNIELNYGALDFVRNEDAKSLQLIDTVELKTNLFGHEFKFDPSLGFSFSTDNGLQVTEILKKNEIFANYVFFTFSNSSNMFFDFLIPNILLKCSVDHELCNGGLKILLDPFRFCLKDEFDGSIFKWNLLLDFKWKKDLSIVKNLKGNIGIGFNSDMSYFFNDIIDFSKDFLNENKNEDVFFILYRPQLFNVNASCDIDFTSLVTKVDKLWFVSECSTSVDLKFELIFGLAVDYIGTSIVDLEDQGNGLFFKFTCDGLKTKLNGGNIENEKLKFFMDNLKLDIFKFSVGFSNKGLKTDLKDIKNTKFDKLGFDLGVTLAKGEFEWAKYGLTFNASILGDDFGFKGTEFKWKDFLSVGVKWDFAKFIDNRNN